MAERVTHRIVRRQECWTRSPTYLRPTLFAVRERDGAVELNLAEPIH